MNSKLNMFFILLLSLIMSCGSDDESTTMEQEEMEEEEEEIVETIGEWELVFEDEFESGLSNWTVWEGGAFNEEIQLYRGEQLSMTDGILAIDIQRESISGSTNPWDTTPKQFEYVSGRIETNALYGPSSSSGESQYRFAAKIKLPAGNGMWPAFWSFGDPWPTQGEIDILEARGGDPNEYQTNIFYGTAANVNINVNTEAEHSPGPDLTADFHIYEMIWKADSIVILFDEERIHTYVANSSNNIANLFGKEQKLVLNTAVGGLFFTDDNSENYADEATMEIDWVRVYKR